MYVKGPKKSPLYYLLTCLLHRVRLQGTISLLIDRRYSFHALSLTPGMCIMPIAFIMLYIFDYYSLFVLCSIDPFIT
jgi:hypothetical protein